MGPERAEEFGGRNAAEGELLSSDFGRHTCWPKLN
jgi:hypothetical protein